MPRELPPPSGPGNRARSDAVRPSRGSVRQSNQSFMELPFKRIALLVAIALAAAGSGPLLAAPESGGLAAACGSPRSAREALFLHQQRARNEARPARLKSAGIQSEQPDWQTYRHLAGSPRKVVAPTQVPVRSGDIALIEASPELLLDPNPVDMSGRTVTIAPGPEGFAVSSDLLPAGTTVEAIGIPLAMEDDDFAVVELPFSFPYYGTEYTHGYVHSDGNFSFVFPEPSRLERNYSRATGGPPRITPFFQDLDPSQGGRVLTSVQASSLTVTWHDVPLWVELGLGDRQTFQMELHSDGRIEFRYGHLNSPHGVVGIFPGVANREAVSLDWSETIPTTIPGDPIVAEVFSTDSGLDEFAVVQQFFRLHEDAYDALVLFNELDINASNASLAHAWPVRNDVEGIGEPFLDYGPYFGSTRRLSSFVNMGATSDYPASPLAPIPSLPHSSLLTILAHELAHRYLAYAPWRDPETGEDSLSLLGRQFSHWSFYFNSSASVLEGNAIRDHGPDASPRFETTAATQGYSQIDKYFMGFVAASDVSATFLVQNATGGRHFGNAARSPEVGVQFDGTRKEVRIEDIVAGAGERRPDSTVSQRHFRYGFALLVEDAEAPDPDAVRKLNLLMANWRSFARLQFDGLATTATELVRMLHLSTFPAGGVMAGGSGTARVTISEPRPTDLTVSLDMQEALATVPASVVIPAGEVFAEFPISGSDAGVTSLTARAGEAGYDTAVTRVNVRDGLAGLTLEKLHGGTVYGVAGSEVVRPLAYRVIDENRVPYSGVALKLESDVPGAAPIPNAVTDFAGRVAIDWPLADRPGLQLLRASVVGEPSAFALTTASVAEQSPAVVATGLVNAASGEAASPGRGFAPGSLVTIHGAGLATETRETDTLLVFGNTGLPYYLGGTRVQIGGARAPLVSVAPDQVTFQIPFDVPGSSTALVVVTFYGRTQFTPIPISPVQPGIFPDRVGGPAGGGVVSSAPGSGRPAAGESLYVYATGLGAVTPAGTTGRSGQSLPPSRVVGNTTAFIDGSEVVVESSALATFEAGVYEVVVHLPGDLAPGTHTLKVAVDGVDSNEVQFDSR